MIEGVGTSQGAAGGVTGANAAARKKPAGASFGAALSAATAAEEKIERVRRAVKPPKGERWEAVPGRSDYADVVSGPRNGWFVNLQEGPRQGQLFHLIRKDGRELHVYGEGKDRQVVEVKRRPRDPEHVRPREGEVFEQVGRHRDYKKIEGGERDDLYVNLSGNVRTGRTFRIEERDGQRFHVYGSGEHAIEVRVGWRSGRGRADDSVQEPGEG